MLDHLLDAVLERHTAPGESEALVLARIRQADSRLTELYRHRDVMALDAYADPLIRAAYLLRYLPHYTLQIGDLLRALTAAPWATLRFLVSPLLISCGAALLIPYLSLYFRLRFGAPDALLGLIFAVVGIATGAATLLAPRLSARLGKPGSVVLTQALAIPCLLLLGLAPTLWAAAAVAVARGALMNMASPLYQAHAMEQTSDAARPAMIGLLGGAYSVGYIVGPTISAEVQRAYGFPPIFAATAACYCLAASANSLIFIRPRGVGR